MARKGKKLKYEDLFRDLQEDLRIIKVNADSAAMSKPVKELIVGISTAAISKIDQAMAEARKDKVTPEVGQENLKL